MIEMNLCEGMKKKYHYHTFYQAKSHVKGKNCTKACVAFISHA